MAALLVITVAAALAPAAAARPTGLSLNCPAQTMQKPFSRWGDYSNYVLAPNGAFESGATGWKLAYGAKVVTGNEPFYVRAKGDRYSLALPPGSSALSGQHCVNLTDPKLRYFFTNTGSMPATLKVEVLYRTALGLVQAREAGSYLIAAKAAWTPAPAKYFLAGVLGVLALDGRPTTTGVQVRFSVTGRGSAVRIDDFYVDPVKIM